MSLYLVHDDVEPVWLAWEDTNDARIYVYSPNVSSFVRNDALGDDFYWERELTYEPLDAPRAQQIISAGRIGRLDWRSHADILERLTARPESMSTRSSTYNPSRTNRRHVDSEPKAWLGRSATPSRASGSPGASIPPANVKPRTICAPARCGR